MMQVNREAAAMMMPIAAAEMQRLKLKRIKRGECPDCGNMLYKTTTGMLGRVRKSIPINEEGKCHDGRCLVCLPSNSNDMIDHFNDENHNDNSNHAEKTIRPLVAPPVSTATKKTPPIPRIILTYQNNSLLLSNGTLPDTNNFNSGNKLDLGLFGLDLNDEVSEITLDRRIRHKGKNKNKSNLNDTANADMNTTKNDSSHRDDDDIYQPEDDMSDKSYSKHNPYHTSQAAAALTSPDSLQESYRNKMKQLFAPPITINHNEPLQVRMARLLEVDVSNTTSNNSNIPDEEIDSEPYSTNKNNDNHHQNTQTNHEIRLDDPEQPLFQSWKVHPASTRKLESAENSIEGIVDDDDRLNDTSAAVRGQSGQQQKSGQHINISPRRTFADKNGVHSTSSTKKIFRPDNIFVSQPSLGANDATNHNKLYDGLGNSILPNIIVEKHSIGKIAIGAPADLFFNQPDVLIERPLQAKHFIAKPEIHFDQHITMAATNDQPSRNEIIEVPDSYNSTSVKVARIPKSVATPPIEEILPSKKGGSIAEIVFDLTAMTTLLEERNAAMKEPRTGEASRGTGDDSLVGFATENGSSHFNDTEYSAYSSKLLMMLEGTDGENEYSTGSTWPSFRVPRINGDDDELTNALSYNKNVEAANVTGDVYQETGIPKVVYSSPSKSSQELPVGKIETATSGIFENDTNSQPPSDSTRLDTREEIDQLLLQLDECPIKESGSSLSRLTDLLLMSSDNPTIRQHFIQRDGAKTLATTLWASMSFPRVEEAAFRLFFALIMVQQNETFQWNDDLAGLIDALLIAMQTNIADVEIQKVGCRIFCSLASQKGNDSDGTRSGACLAVLNAMDEHANVESVQEWGLRALYNQCSFSQNAEANKRIVITSKLDVRGSTCFDVLERIVRQGEYDFRRSGVMEWLYRLYWCLTSSISLFHDSAPLRMDSIRELLIMLETCRATTDASPQLQEAALGLIANLMKIDYYKSFLGTPDVVLLILDTMHARKEFVQVQIEACNAIANIAILLSPDDKEELIDAAIVRTIVGALYAFPSEKALLQEPALRALLGLANDSEIAKAEICESKTLSVIMLICRLDENSTQPQQELLCKLLVSLYSSDRSITQAIQCDTIGALTAALFHFRKSDKLSEAGCCAYRNLSRNDSTFDTLIKCNAIGFVVHSMIAFNRSEAIQINACWVLWNLGVATDIGPQKIADMNAMKEIVITIQTHLDSYDVTDVACGTLWSLIHRSNVLLDDFCDNPTGLESVVCTLMMHPDKTSLLEKVCGILAYISRNLNSIPMAVMPSGVSNVIETMCNNPRVMMILQHGAHFLRNIVAAHHEYAAESVHTIAVLMNALKGSDVPVPFLGEVLYFLWVMAEISSPAKAIIITMDGLPIAMSILDQFRGGRIPFVEDPALGLFKELADKPSQYS